MSASVSVAGLTKSYMEHSSTIEPRAVDGISFDVEAGTFFTLLGPSGCGKTTTMRCIAGLERIDGGSIAIGGSAVSALEPPVFVPPNKRKIGMVFQSYAIWPHMTVLQNIIFPLKAQGLNPRSPEARERAEEALSLVKLDGLASRMATQLSGGQQQRLALARALVARPQLLLLDEPLSNLDARLREHMRIELRALQRRLGITTIYVTHDQVEALSMSDRIAVMHAGKIIQEGTPADMYHRPSSPFVAQFLGTSNIVEARVISRDGNAQRCVVESVFGTAAIGISGSFEVGDAVSISVRPEHIRVHTNGGAPAHGLNARVTSTAFLGEITEYELIANDTTLRYRRLGPLDVGVGDQVILEIPPEACIPIERTL